MTHWDSSAYLAERAAFRGHLHEYLVREPDAGKRHVRFDERDVETGSGDGYLGTGNRKVR